MTIGLLGKKCGMTRVFTEDGASIPVTVIEVLPNRITQVKTLENDGYRAIQITVGERKRSKITSAQAGHFAKANAAPGTKLMEFRLDEEDECGESGSSNFTVGGEVKGKKMCGHMGDVKRTILNQPIVKIDVERNLVLVRGAVPGAENGYVVIRPAVKKKTA